MRRFELVEGSSSKFWEIALDGSAVTVRFGRIGTAGQSKTKTFASDGEARREHDKLVKEKTGKGYAEVAVADGAILPAVPMGTGTGTATGSGSGSGGLNAQAAPTSVHPQATATALAHAAAADPGSFAGQAGAEASAADAADRPAPALSAGESASASSIPWPCGGFQWTPELRGERPVVRGIRITGARSLAYFSVDKPLEVDDDDRHGFMAHQFAALAQHAGRPWQRWTPADWAERQQRDRLACADAQAWLELSVQSWTADALPRMAPTPYRGRQMMQAWVTNAGLAVHGLPFMVERALDLGNAMHGHGQFHIAVSGMLVPLREAVAATTREAHDAVIAVLEQHGHATPARRVVRAHLAPHRADWAAAARADQADPEYLLRECVQPVEAALEDLKRTHPYLPYVKPALLLQAHLHGEAAFPLFAHMVRAAHDRESAAQFIDLALLMRTPALVHLLAELIERKEARAALERLADEYPAAVLKTVIERAFATRSRLAEGWAVRFALREPAVLAQTLPALSASGRAHFEGLLAALQTRDAPPEQLPPVLREPPWLDKARNAELPTLDVPPRPTAERLTWTEAERAQHASARYAVWKATLSGAKDMAAIDTVLAQLCITEAARPRVLNAEPLQPGDVHEPDRYAWDSCVPNLLLRLPAPSALVVWNGYPAALWKLHNHAALDFAAVLAFFGEAAIPGLVHLVQAQPELGLNLALAVDSPRLVPAVLHALRNLKKSKPLAIEWLRSHPRTALTAALPQAFGSDRAQRDNAQHGLRWFATNGFEAEARAVAAEYGATMAQALPALLDADPLRVLPSRMPKLPSFFVAAAFRRPLLREGGAALGAAAVEHVGTMLAISQLDAPYAGLAVVREACTPASLAEFAWDVFEAWLAAGAPSKDNWALLALGLLGDDETARRLAPRIREWPGESQHQRAVLGLDLLAAIGSDVALMHLNGIAGKVKFKALQERAREKIAAVAQARGLTAAELADRLVPDLGLDDDGTLRLDFGPRHFTVAFDEALKPFVRDAAGVRLKDLPKPLKTDDAALAAAATERYKQVKKDAKAVASLQVVRLEMAMVERRRWSAADFQLFFLQHPLMRHLAARLVWGVYSSGSEDGEPGPLTAAFRVAEDFTMADADDTAYALPAEASVGIAHALEMPRPLQQAFGQLFADYEILQPFRQLGRETYALTAEERLAADIKRYADNVVSTGSVMGLLNRGWERDGPMDGGWVSRFSKRIGAGLELRLELDPGTLIGVPNEEPKQRIPSVTLRQAGTWGDEGRRSFEQLDPITTSELLRELDLLAPLQG